MSKNVGFLFFKIGRLGQIWPRFGPNYVHLTHFVTGVGSSNLKYALTVDYFQKCTMSQSHGFLLSKLVVLAGFGPKLARIWANLVHLKA